MNRFKALDTDALWTIFDNQCSNILRLAAMTPEELRTSKDDKANPPSGSVETAIHFFNVCALELERRGELPEGWLVQQD